MAGMGGYDARWADRCSIPTLLMRRPTASQPPLACIHGTSRHSSPSSLAAVGVRLDVHRLRNPGQAIRGRRPGPPVRPISPHERRRSRLHRVLAAGRGVRGSSGAAPRGAGDAGRGGGVARAVARGKVGRGRDRDEGGERLRVDGQRVRRLRPVLRVAPNGRPAAGARV